MRVDFLNVARIVLQRKDDLPMLLSISLISISAAAGTTIVVTGTTQGGFFKTGTDVGPMNPHSYRPNEFVTNDFIYEGLVAYDGNSPNGADDEAGTMDDFIVGSLATSWVTNLVGLTQSAPFEITFTLRSGVTFHDGTPWNAAAAKANFDHIMGGTGAPGALKRNAGFHDWLGLTQYLDSWSVVDNMRFKLTFTTYYDTALLELSTIRPFRMVSVAVLPDISRREISLAAWRQGAPRQQGPTGDKYTARGVSAPIGTGPYMVVDKLLVKPNGSSRRLPAADFNATCYTGNTCVYQTGEVVKEVLFKKHEGHWKKPTYDNVIYRSYDSQGDVKAALEDGTLDIAYGVGVFTSSMFLALATDEGSSVVAHKAPTGINTRLLVLNSGSSRLGNLDLRKLIMGILEATRQNLYDGELAEEIPTNTLFDPTAPHCSVLATLSTPSALAATKSPSITAANVTRPLRFMYIRDVPHNQVIAAEVIATLVGVHGIAVEPMPVDKATYNARHCDWLANPNGLNMPDYAYGDPTEAAQDNYHAWDIAYSETWGPPYDPAAKLWDMTHASISGYCSSEADAPAISGMSTMSFTTFTTKARALSTIMSKTARTTAYDEVLTTLHNEAIFLPLTEKRNVAVTNKRVEGFKFGFMEFDLPLANLKPVTTTEPTKSWAGELYAAVCIGAILGGFLLIFVCYLISRERQGKPVFTSLESVSPGPGGSKSKTDTGGSKSKTRPGPGNVA